MKLGWHARRRWSLVVLLVGLPAYVIVATTLVGRLERPGVLVELLIYAALGVVWALPLRFLFSGVARPDPGQESPRERTGK